MDVIHECRVADLDALRQAHDIERSGPPSTGPYQQKVPDRRSASIEPLKVGTGAIVNDVHASPPVRRRTSRPKLSLCIDDDVLGAGLLAIATLSSEETGPITRPPP